MGLVWDMGGGGITFAAAKRGLVEKREEGVGGW